MLKTEAKLVDNEGFAFGLERAGNRLVVLANTLGIAIAAGDKTDSSLVHKFGSTPDFDTTDGLVTVWDGADDGGIDEMQYNYSTAPLIDTVSSSDAGDTQALEVQGLDSNWNLTTQNVTLSGQSQVTMIKPLIRVFRAKNIGTTDNAGSIYIFEQTADAGGDGIPDDTTKIRAIIRPGNNQTLMAVFSIPSDRQGFLMSLFAATSGAKKTASYNIELRIRPFGGVFQLKHQSNVIEDGTSNWNHLFQALGRIPNKSDIEVRAKINTSSITVASVSAGFDLILVDD